MGDVRIGVARSDPSGLVATPVETVARGDGDLARIRQIVDEEGAVEVVVGLPRSLSGVGGARGSQGAGLRRGDRGGAATDPGAALRRAAVDRQRRDGASRGRRPKTRRAVVDQAAATLILQNALDNERATGRPPGESVEIEEHQ